MILYAIDDDDEPAAKMHSSASRISDEARCATEQTPDTDSATENYDSTGLPVDLPAEFIRFIALLHCSALLLGFTVPLFCSASLFCSTAPRCY